MATSGSYDFDPTFATMLDEAMERAGINPASSNHQHIKSAKMALNFMFNQWQIADSDVLYRIATSSATLSAGTSSFALASGAYDIIDAVIDRGNDGSDTPFARASRQDFLNVVDKDLQGVPYMYYVDHSTLNTPTAHVYPVPSTTVVVRYDYMRYVQTVGSLSETLDLHRPWLEAAVSGLAAAMALKFNIERYALLKPLADEAYRIAKRAGSGNSRVIITGRGFGRTRTRRAS